MNNILSNIIGPVPEVPIKVVIDDNSIMRLSLAVVVAAAIILLLAKLINKGGK